MEEGSDVLIPCPALTSPLFCCCWLLIWQAVANARTSALPKRAGKSVTEIHARIRFRLRLQRRNPSDSVNEGLKTHYNSQ